MIAHLRSIPFCFGCALVFALPARAQKLPDTITVIRVEAVQSNSMQIQKVVGSDILQGKDTQRFIAKWNSLKRLSGKSDCSLHPAYRLWLYEDKAKLSQCVAICFECHRIYLLEPSNSDHLGNGYLFEDSSAAHDMRKTLARLFPGHDPDAQ